MKVRYIVADGSLIVGNIYNVKEISEGGYYGIRDEYKIINFYNPRCFEIVKGEEQPPEESPPTPEPEPTKELTPRELAIDAVAKVEALLCDIAVCKYCNSDSVPGDVMPCKYCAISCVVNFRAIPEAPEPSKEVEFAEAFKHYFKKQTNKVRSILTNRIFDWNRSLHYATDEEIDGKWELIEEE
jgi:hypothetical protein